MHVLKQKHKILPFLLVALLVGVVLTVKYGRAASTVGNDIYTTGTVTVGAGGIIFNDGSIQTAASSGTITGNLSVGGNSSLGDQATDTITLTGVVNSGLTFVREVARTVQISNSTTTNAAGSTLTLQGAAGNGAGNGGALSIIGGASTSGTGGVLTLTSGSSTSGATGAITINSGNALGTSRSGDITIAQGTPVNAQPGDITVGSNTAPSGGPAAGGGLTLRSTPGGNTTTNGATAGNGGSITIVAGAAGNSTVSGAATNNSGQTGIVTITGGASGLLSNGAGGSQHCLTLCHGGAVNINGGPGVGGLSGGGAVNVRGGNSDANALYGGGAITLVSGQAGEINGPSGSSGAITIQTAAGQQGGSQGGQSGAITIETLAGGPTQFGSSDSFAGGVSGTITIRTNTAGAALLAGALGGPAGAINLTGGTGGASVTATAGAGSSITLTPGAGGTTSGAGTGGRGGSVTILGGAGGGTSGGTAGNPGGLRVGTSRVIFANKSTAAVALADAAAAPTVTQVLDAGIFTMTPTATRTFTLPTAQGAAGIVQNLPGTRAVGDVFDFFIANNGTAANLIDLTNGTGSTFNGPDIAGLTARPVWCRVTNITAGTETIDCY